MDYKMTLTDWIKAYDNGEFDALDVDTQISAGWYDWFCKESSLAAKTKKLAVKVKKIAKSSKINMDKMYVFFKNNCPMNGSLYDDFRICDLETGDVIFTVTPSNGHRHLKGTSDVWGKENGFNEPIISGSWKDVLNFFDV